MDIEQHRFSQNEIDSYCLPLQNDLISIFGILEDAAADLLDQAVKNGWTPDQYIDELNKLIDESSAPQETTVVPELQEIKVNKSMEDNMPVSTPKSGEKEQDYVSRVIGELIGAGKPKDQAAAIAHSAYRNNVQKARSVGGFESPEPGDIPEKDKKLLADVYAKYRKTGMSKEDSAKRAWGAVHNATKSKISKDAGNGIIDPEQLRIGTMEEMKEHRVTLQEGMRIAIDHLREIPDYYTRMRKCGL